MELSRMSDNYASHLCHYHCFSASETCSHWTYMEIPIQTLLIGALVNIIQQCCALLQDTVHADELITRLIAN